MKRRLKATLGLVALAALALSISACSGTFSFSLTGSTPDISGKVVDAQTGAAMDLSGATVTLTNIKTGKTYTATQTTTGTWAVDSAAYGDYTISVTQGGYFFTSFTAPLSYTSGSVTAPTLAGMNTSSFTGLFNFILMWNTGQQLDLHLTVPTANISWSLSPSGYANPATYSTTGSFFMDSPNYQPKNSDELSFWNQGFGPNGGYAGSGTTFARSGRTEISKYSGSTTKVTDTSGNTLIALDTTATSYGPTTISFMGGIVYGSSYQMALNGTGAASASYPYNLLDATNAPTALQGVAELYADAPDTSTTTNYISTAAGSTTPSSDAVLYVVGKSTAGGSAALLGKFVVPTNIQLKTISLARINITDTEYQIVPNIQAVTNGAFKTIAGTSSSQVINVPFRTNGQ